MTLIHNQLEQQLLRTLNHQLTTKLWPINESPIEQKLWVELNRPLSLQIKTPLRHVMYTFVYKLKQL